MSIPSLVEDIQRSKKFYTEIIGLEVLHDWGNMIVFQERFSIHSANTLLPERETQKFIHPGTQGRNNVIIYCETADLESEFQRMIDKGVRILHGIVELPWQKIFRMYDPDNLFSSIYIYIYGYKVNSRILEFDTKNRSKAEVLPI